MYVIRNTKTKEILAIHPSSASENLKPEQVYPSFDGETMEYGITDLSYVPSHFNITDEHVITEHTLEEKHEQGIPVIAPHQKFVEGKVVEKNLSELLDDGQVTIEQVKQRVIDHYSAISFQKRKELIPDYQLGNASLGVYDEQRTANYKATVQAFRDESLRLQGLVEKANSLDEIQAIKVEFPTEIITAPNINSN